MGGGGGGTFSRRSPEELVRQVRKAEDQTTIAEFEARLSNLLGDLLASCNDRDTDMVQDRLNAVKKALEREIGGSFDQLFGGSVAKHTYVDGLSDIDSLLLINDTALIKKSPQEALSRIRTILTRAAEQLGGEVVEIAQGRMAVTVTFRDGMILQLLPAIRGPDEKLHVPSSRRDAWSRIDPEAFNAALTKRNQECANKLVPTVKLAKAVLGELPEGQRLAGYHVESLAIAAFKNYGGIRSTSAMLPVFFERAKDLVLAPIRDSSGQSIHVDEYLGESGSEVRRVYSHILARIAKRMRNASASASEAQWRAIFGLDA